MDYVDRGGDAVDETKAEETKAAEPQDFANDEKPTSPDLENDAKQTSPAKDEGMGNEEPKGVDTSQADVNVMTIEQMAAAEGTKATDIQISPGTPERVDPPSKAQNWTGETPEPPKPDHASDGHNQDQADDDAKKA